MRRNIPICPASPRPFGIAVGSILVSIVLVASSCGSGSGDPDRAIASTSAGEGSKHDERFFRDPNRGGRAPQLRLEEVSWGRLVDVHDIDAATGELDPIPVFRDWVVSENLQADGQRYLLETNSLSRVTRLVVLREEGAPAVDGETFESVLRDASQDLAPIAAKHDDGSSSAPFSQIARNACLILRFNDLLDDADVRNLEQQVRLVTGYTPSTPFSARILFDRNHGGIGYDGQFHSTRILIDTTRSTPGGTASLGSAGFTSSAGLPASQPGESAPNLSLRLATRVDFATGAFATLANLQGNSLAIAGNGPIDATVPTVDVVRAMRTGNREDVNNGLLADLTPPELLGTWSFSVLEVEPDPDGAPGVDFLIDIQFETVCSAQPRVGDLARVSGRILEVTAPGSPPQAGFVPDLRVRVIGGGHPDQILGSGFYRTTYDTAVAVDPACWFQITPQPGDFPAGAVSPELRVTVHFSEPMDPGTLLPFDTFFMTRGPSSMPTTARTIVVGEVGSSTDLATFGYEPVLPLAHEGNNELYTVRLISGQEGAKDLAGNALTAAPPAFELSVDAGSPFAFNGGIALRFDAADELDPELGFDDLRGQFTYNFEEGRIDPRPVARRAIAVDRTQPTPSIMIPSTVPVATPLTPLGSKVQSLWRYADAGWRCDDESNFNIDVLGLNWAPSGGVVHADFYDEFEIALSHANRLPDEALDAFLLPRWPQSGLLSPPSTFLDNVLLDQRVPQQSQTVVHPRSLGYFVDPTALFTSETGTLLVPYPWNSGAGEETTYTWRDTAITTLGGANGAGIPMDIETRPPLSIDPRPSGSVAQAGSIPSFGLPLLMEFRAFPTDSAIGLNRFDISLAINSSARPNFRAFSAGGFDQNGLPVTIDPDLALVPTGGFNPSAGGTPTPPTDNIFHIGQFDVVTRLSRVHTIFLDSRTPAPDYSTPILEWTGDGQASGTDVTLEYRGATGFPDPTGDAAFDAARIDPYGNPRADVDGDGIPESLPVNFWNDDPTWKASIDALDGATFLQVRITFVNDIETGEAPDLASIGFAFSE